MTDKDSNQKKDTTPKFELKITGEGVAIDREISESQLVPILQIAMRDTPAAGAASLPDLPTETPGTNVNVGDMSLGEFVQKMGAKRNPEKIVAMAVYLDKQGISRFSRADIKRKFPEAGEPTPGNFPRDFKWAVETKWIALDTGTKDKYHVTSSGRKALERKFSDEVRKGSKLRRGRRRASSRKAE